MVNGSSPGRMYTSNRKCYSYFSFLCDLIRVLLGWCGRGMLGGWASREKKNLHQLCYPFYNIKRHVDIYNIFFYIRHRCASNQYMKAELNF